MGDEKEISHVPWWLSGRAGDNRVCTFTEPEASQTANDEDEQDEAE